MRTFHDELKDLNGYSLMNNIPVQVVTINGCFEFTNLKLAKEQFSTLDPFKNGNDFTWAMRDGDKMRFEDWKINQMMSC